MVMYKIEEVKEFSLAAKCLELGRQQFDEVVGDKEGATWDLDLSFAQLAFNAGLIHMLIAKDEEGSIVGYFANLINLDMFTKVYKARDIGIFAHPDHRRSGLFKQMLDEMEKL